MGGQFDHFAMILGYLFAGASGLAAFAALFGWAIDRLWRYLKSVAFIFSLLDEGYRAKQRRNHYRPGDTPCD